MTKRLMESTALAALVAMGTTSGAVAAERIQLGISGYFDAFFVAGSEDDGVGEPAANRRGHKVAREGEVVFEGMTTLDNGLKVGVVVELESETCADQIDESYIWFEGTYGRFQLGSDDGPMDKMYYGAPTPSKGAGVATPNQTFVQYGGQAVATPATIVALSGDGEKLMYFTPRIGGFQFGISYTPDSCEENTAASTGFACGGSYAGFQLDNNLGQQSEVVEMAINYVNKFGDVDVALFGGYGHGDLEQNDGARTFDDREAWTVGAQFGYAGFVLGGSYKEDDLGLSGSFERKDMAIGLTYTWSAWTVGVQYYHGEVEQGAGGGEDETDAIEVGGQYAIGPGIVLTGGLQFWDIQDDAGAAANENEAVIFFVGTSLSF